MAAYQLRAGNAGPIVEGETDGDTLVWSASLRRWVPGSGGGGGLPPGDEFNQVATWNPDSEGYEPKGRLATVVIASLEQLEAAFPAAEGVHTITGGVVEFQVDLDLGTNRIVVTGPARLQGWGATKISSTFVGSTMHIQASGVELRSLHLDNVGNTSNGYALSVDVPSALGKQGRASAYHCSFGSLVADGPWSLPVVVNSGLWFAQDCVIGDGAVLTLGDGDAPSIVMNGCAFVVNNTILFGVELLKPTDWVRLQSCYFRDSRAGMLHLSSDASADLLELLDNVEGYAGSLSNAALLVEASFTNNLKIKVSRNTLAGGIYVAAQELLGLSVTDNQFVSHQNSRVPFVGFEATSDGVCVRNNWDQDTFVYLPESALAA